MVLLKSTVIARMVMLWFRTNQTIMCHAIYENGRGGLICPPYGIVLHKPNRYVPQYYGLHKFDE